LLKGGIFLEVVGEHGHMEKILENI
jgi:hypothetical protein